MSRSRFLLVSVSLALSVSACEKKAPEPPAPHEAPAPSSNLPPAAFLQPASLPHGHPAVTGGQEPSGHLVWSDPPGWTRLDQSSPMRLATYRVPHTGSDKEDGEMAIFHFGGGQGGNVEANLSRWEHQFTDTKAGGTRRSERTVNGLHAHILEVDSGTYTAMAMMPGQSSTPKSTYGMIAAVLETPLGSYFFKMTGPAKTVKSAKDAFMTMLDGVKVQS